MAEDTVLCEILTSSAWWEVGELLTDLGSVATCSKGLGSRHSLWNFDIICVVGSKRTPHGFV